MTGHECMRSASGVRSRTYGGERKTRTIIERLRLQTMYLEVHDLQGYFIIFNNMLDVWLSCMLDCVIIGFDKIAD